MRTSLLACVVVLAAACSPKTDAAKETESAPGAASAEPAPPAQAAQTFKPATPDDITLRRGFYVEGDTKCAEASNATLQLLRRAAISSSHVVCDWTKVEARNDLSFKVTQSCSDDGAAFGGQTNTETQHVTIDMQTPQDFVLGYEGGGTSKFHHCEQSSLPEPWRDNDIADLIK